jgi:hypothetical protein
MKNKTYGPWENFGVSIISEGVTTNLVMQKRRKPNGSFEITGPSVVHLLKPRKNKPNGNIQAQLNNNPHPNIKT